MDLDLEKLSKEELLQLFLESEARAKDQEKELQRSEANLEKIESENQRKESIIQKSESENKWLTHQLTQLRRMLFGSKSERFEGDTNQMKIEFEEYATEEEKKDETPVKETITYEREKKSKKHNGRNRLPENLKVVEHIIEPVEDTSEMKKIGEERTEILEYVPEKFFKLVLIRPKYVRLEKNQVLELNTATKNVVIASLPSLPIEKCLAGNDLLSAVLINKYVDHLPLYRQQQIFKRSDIEIAPSTIDSWVAQLGKLLEPLYDRLSNEIKAQTYLQADEPRNELVNTIENKLGEQTTTKVLDRNKKGKTHLGYYWTYHAPLSKLVAFDYQKGRGKDAPREFLENYKGALQTDGYAVYKQYYASDEVTHLACWAHARRKFDEALPNDKKRSEHALLEIQKLYAIERETKELSSEERKEIRLEKSLPIINELGKWLHNERQQTLPKSPIGKAIAYTTSLWDSLQNYLHNGYLNIDNNLIENSIRPIALGRKNYLFAGSHNGAKRSAMFYSFFACCKLNNINPQKWLQYVLENIADHKVNKLHELLPNNINPEKLENFKKFWEV
jgi:transposase